MYIHTVMCNFQFSARNPTFQDRYLGGSHCSQLRFCEAQNWAWPTKNVDQNPPLQNPGYGPALYMHMFNLFVSRKTPLPEDLLPGVQARLIRCNDTCAENCTLDEYVHITARTESECSEVYSGFVSFWMDLAPFIPSNA